MASHDGRSWTVADRPVGRALRPSDFALITRPAAAPKAGEIAVRLLYLSFAPSMKIQMENAAPYAPPIALGEVMRGAGAAVVVDSKHPDFAPGDIVSGNMEWSEYSTLAVEGVGLRRPIKLDPDIAPWAGLAVLQSGGLTAYFGLLEIGALQPGETVVVSGAAGGVGSNVGQIARIIGARTIGIAGGAHKCAWLKDNGFDEAVDYRAGDVTDRLRALAPQGVEVFFDNVGGAVLEAGIANMARHGRIVVCGAISQYGNEQRQGALGNHMELVFRSARMQGFLVTDFVERYDEARARLTGWLRSGALRPQVDILGGFENAPAALIRLFEGKNIGRQMLRVAQA